jgi:CubicO group peptidase (beta-lactamase class C family)
LHNHLRNCTIGLVTLLLFILASHVVAGTPDLPGRLQAAADDVVRRGALATIIAVELPGGDRIKAASGFVDRGKTIPMDAGRGFQIGSITKTFTSAAIMLLEKEGKIDLDARLSDFVQGYMGSPDVTIRHLLTHTSGIGDGQVYVDIPQPYTREHFSLDDFLVMGRIQGKQFEPGEGFAYNNLAFYILGDIVEQVSGTRLNDFLRDRVFNPLSMNDTYVGTYDSWPHDSMARGYYRNPGASDVIETTGPEDLSIAGPAGDMISTADNLLNWLDAIVEDGDPVGLSLDDFTSDAAEWKANLYGTSYGTWLAYGRGFMNGSLAGEIVWGHAGGIHGYGALAFIHPASGVRFVMAVTQDADPAKDDSGLYGVMQMAMAAVIQAAADAAQAQ